MKRVSLRNDGFLCSDAREYHGLGKHPFPIHRPQIRKASVSVSIRTWGRGLRADLESLLQEETPDRLTVGRLQFILMTSRDKENGHEQHWNSRSAPASSGSDFTDLESAYTLGEVDNPAALTACQTKKQQPVPNI